jgi:hypothetical protein
VAQCIVEQIDQHALNFLVIYPYGRQVAGHARCNADSGFQRQPGRRRG